MHIRIWIILLTFLTSFSIDNQSVMAQPVGLITPQDIFSQLESAPATQLTMSIAKDANGLAGDPSIIIARPLENSKNQIQKINKSNWKLASGKKALIQKFDVESGRQIYFRLDRIQLNADQSVVIYDILNQKVLEFIDGNLSRHLAGPFIAAEVGIAIHGVESIEDIPLEIGEIYVGAMDFGYDSSFECHENINCSSGEKYRDQERSVARITMVLEEGIGYCTGALMSTAKLNNAPYFLTAFHCQDGYTPIYDLWTFDFGYESFSCANPDTEPSRVTMTGCSRVAGHMDTDMLLLKLSEEPSVETNAYFSGWNRDPQYNPEGAVLIHHPRGDIKKITTDNDVVIPHPEALKWDNGITTGAQSHFVTRFDVGTYQGGSSGAPLFDHNGLIVAQLHGGPEDDELCNIGIGYHGRFAKSWEGGGTPESRLKDWLDPDNSGEMTVPGHELNSSSNVFVSFIGRLITPDGIAIPNVEVTVNGDKKESFRTGPDGRFEFDNLPKSGTYTMSFTKNNNHGNGISALDMVQIMNHIIGGNPLRGVFQQRSADANSDGKVSSLDLVQILNVIIGKTDEFPNNTSWQFEPSTISMNAQNINATSLDLSIIGYKIGDVNFSANPRN